MAKKSILTIVLFFFLNGTLYAEAYISKDWIWDHSEEDDFFYAVTSNSSENLLGQYCYVNDGNCVYLVGLGTTCEEGHETPALINSNSGALHVTLICAHKYDDQNVMIITPFEDIDNIIRAANYLRIALPMENDQFKVSRFSLSGSSYAIDLMRAAAERVYEKKPQTKTNKDVEYL